jgi:hypothetical protein
MGWVRWSRKGSEPFQVGAGTVGADLNATRLRAMSCATGQPPKAIPLDDPFEDLPLAVSLERRPPELGRAAHALERKTPHLTCFGFLNEINQPRRWEIGRRSVDAADLLALVFERFRAVCPKPDNFTLALPVYLNTQKVTALANVIDKAKLSLRGSVLLPLALLAAADPSERRPAFTLIVDVDDHALTGSLVHCEANQARLLGTTVQPRLNLRAWKDRILNSLADRCVRVCRRDPRDSAVAEQALFEQLDDALDRLRDGQKVDLTVRSTHWYQNLILQPDDFDGYCAPMARQTVAALQELLQAHSPEPPQAVWLTHAAGRLPGLAAALHSHMAERTGVAVLPADAGARAAVALAARWARDELPRTHLDAVVLLPEGPAREQSRPAFRENNGAATYRGFRIGP